jgi:hypothetical protein
LPFERFSTEHIVEAGRKHSTRHIVLGHHSGQGCPAPLREFSGFPRGDDLEGAAGAICIVGIDMRSCIF